MCLLVHKDQPMMLQYLAIQSLVRHSQILQTHYQSHVQGKFQTLTSIPHCFFVADEAYPLKTYLLKPYSARGLTVSERIYNYRLSRARRTVENSFGILVNRFCILRESMQLQPECVCDVVMVCCALHNFMRSKVSASYCPDEGILSNTGTAERSNNIYHEERTIGASYNASAKLVRDKLAVYFVGPGQKSFRWKHGNVDI